MAAKAAIIMARNAINVCDISERGKDGEKMFGFSVCIGCALACVKNIFPPAVLNA